MLTFVLCLVAAVAAVPVPEQLTIELATIPTPYRIYKVEARSAEAAEESAEEPAEETAEEPVEEPAEEPKAPSEAAPAPKGPEPPSALFAAPIIVQLDDPAPPSPSSSGLFGLFPFPSLASIPFLPSKPSFPTFSTLPNFPFPSISNIPGLSSFTWPSWLPSFSSPSGKVVAYRYPAYMIAEPRKE